jgi:hypothetical protein
MRFEDYSPPSSPWLDQQRDALRKGLGRAMQWAIERSLDDEALLAACLEDQRYDTQLEYSRGDWLWKMILAVAAADRFRVPILHALYELADERDATQLCELGRCYAEAGDETFRNRLYEIVEQKPISDSGWIGEEEIVRLDGEAGFLFAVRVRGERLAGRAWEWDDDGLFRQAGERLGEGRVTELMEGSTHPAIRAYWNGWQRENRSKADPGPQLSYRERMRAIPIKEILTTAGSGDSRFGRLRGWGMHAEASELAMVFHHLSEATEAKVIADLLRVFSNRPDPQFVVPFIALCRHEDPEVRRRAFVALEQNSHPLIREFALSNLEQGTEQDSVLGLFNKNFLPGDEGRILEAIEVPDDEQQRHGLMMDVIRFLESNPNADCSQLSLVAYISTPCESCRSDAARLLLGQRVAPGWLLEECRHDSNEESCKLVVGLPR